MMMIDEVKIMLAMKRGAPLTCATCRLWHVGGGQCGKETCGGPPSGRDFPDYDGPLPRERFREVCLICGSKAWFILLVPDTPTAFGLCKDHKDIFDKIPPPTGVVAARPIVLALPGD